MFNNWFTIGPITIHGYGVMIAVGILSAIWFAQRQAKRHNMDPDSIDMLAITAVVVGYIFSKLTYVLTVWDAFLENPMAVLGSSGWVVYGGIIGGIFGAWLYCKIRRMNFIAYLNLCMPSVALAQGFGRIGCFLAGCCYGRPTDSSFGITFTNSAYAPNGISLIPTQLISSGLDFLHFSILLYIAKHKKAEGQVGGFYLIFYSIGRFVLEFFRGDMERGSVGELSTSQFIAIFTLIAGIVIVAGSQIMASRNVRPFLVGPHGTALVSEEKTDGVQAEQAAEEEADAAKQDDGTEQSGEESI